VAVGVGEGSGHVGADLGGVRCRQRSRVAKERGQRLAVNELHHDEVGAGVLAPVEDRTMLGCERLAAAWASRRKRSTKARSMESSGKRTLRAPGGRAGGPVRGRPAPSHSRDEVGQLVAVREDARVWTGPWLSEPTPRPRGARAIGAPAQRALSQHRVEPKLHRHEPAGSAAAASSMAFMIGPATSHRWPRPIGTARRPPQRSSGWTRARGDHPVVGGFCPVEGRLGRSGLDRRL